MEQWRAVDDYFAEKLAAPDAALDEALAANARDGLPAIDVAPNQGKLLELLARMVGARRILEMGALGGYAPSGWLARSTGTGASSRWRRIPPTPGRRGPTSTEPASATSSTSAWARRWTSCRRSKARRRST